MSATPKQSGMPASPRQNNRGITVRCLTLAAVSAFGFLAAGCALEDDSVDPAPVDPQRSVYAGVAQDPAAPEKAISVGLVMHEGELRFFACGDEAQETFTAWASGTDVDDSSAEIPFEAKGKWRVHGVATGTEAHGIAVKDTNDDGEPEQELSWSAESVPGGNIAGLYADDALCQTGVVVLPDGTVMGSYCVGSSSIRAQVTPLAPPDGAASMAGLWLDSSTGGIFVRLETDEPVLVKPLDPSAR